MVRIDLGHGHDPRSGCASHRDRCKPAPRGCWARHRGSLVHDRCARVRGAPRRRRGGADVCGRAVSRELCRAPRRTRDDGASRRAFRERPSAIGTAGLRRSASTPSHRKTACSFARAMWCRWTASSREGTAVLDQSALTGESLPVRKGLGEPVMSGVTNAGDAFDLTATHRAAESTYAGIVRLIEAARASKAPMARLADRFAIAFLALTVVLAGGAWLWSGDPIRALAVLVVATPCPLILAVPVAIVSGVSRAAKAGVLVKGGKSAGGAGAGTGVGHRQDRHADPRARRDRRRFSPMPGFPPRKLLQLAASLDQASKHVIARALVREAQARA